MATDNKGVMVYLPPDLEAVLEKYCLANKITRKAKDGGVVPSMGTGIVQYLKSQLLGVASSNMSSASLTRDDVQAMIDEAMQLSVDSASIGIPARLEALEGAVDAINSQLTDKPRRVLPNLTAPITGSYRVDR